MLHAPSQRRERVLLYADNGGGKSSTYISIADWMDRTKSDRRIWLMDSDKSWEANRDPTGALDRFFDVTNLDVEEFGGERGWAAKARRIRGSVHPDDWCVVDTQTTAWEGAQRWYWGQRSGNDSLAELWLKHSAIDIAGDHGTNWGIINKFYGEFRSVILGMPCHVLLLATAKPIRQPSKGGTGGDSREIRTFYETAGMQIEGQKDLRGDGHSVIYAFEANGTYRYTTVKEKGPIGRPKREMLLNEDVTDKGFVGGYLIKVAGWRP